MNFCMKNRTLFLSAIYIVLSLSIALMLCCSSATHVVNRTVNALPIDDSVFVIWKSDLRSDDLNNFYHIEMKTPDNSITGLCILKKKGVEWNGTFINETMVKIFDFIMTDKKSKLLHVIFLMDKWYIKKTVAADLHFLFNIDNINAPYRKKIDLFEQDGIKVVNYRKKQLLVKPDRSIVLINRRYKLQYKLRKITENK